jgi:hypothetical protein
MSNFANLSKILMKPVRRSTPRRFMTPSAKFSSNPYGGIPRAPPHSQLRSARVSCNLLYYHHKQALVMRKAHPVVPGWSICSIRVPCAGDLRRARGGTGWRGRDR